MIVDTERWRAFLEGYTIYDCAIGFDNSRFCFLLLESTGTPHRDPLPETRFLFVRTERPVETRFYAIRFDHFGFARVEYHEQGNTKEFLSVDSNGNVFCYNGSSADEEKTLDRWFGDNHLFSSCTRIKRSHNELFLLGIGRRINKRNATDSWTLYENIPIPQQMENKSTGSLEFGFEDISAFSREDIYAVGGTGDVWHFDGVRWSQIPFPSNELLYTVCCGGDGFVYITGNMGSLWMGRKDRWKRLSPGRFSTPFKDSVWFAGRLWCGSDYGLWELRDGGLSVPDQPPSVRNACGVIDVSPDGTLMLTASPHGAAIFDGLKWELLFSSFAFSGKSERTEAQKKLGRGEARLTEHDGMQALLDVIGNDGAAASLAALDNPDYLDLAALRAHSWLLLVNAISAQKADAEYGAVVTRLLALGADPDAVDLESGLTPRKLASTMDLPFG